jgi:hypothetical protein
MEQEDSFIESFESLLDTLKRLVVGFSAYSFVVPIFNICIYRNYKNYARFGFTTRGESYWFCFCFTGAFVFIFIS